MDVVGIDGEAQVLAGFGGGVLTYQLGALSPGTFTAVASINLLAVAYIGGIAVVSGALVAGLIVNGGVLYVLLSHVGGLSSWWAILSGVGLLLTAVLNPDGVAVAYSSMWRALKRKLADRRTGGKPRMAAAGGEAPR